MKNGNEPINPLPSDVDSSKVECKGLTKREYFAGLAMQGILSSRGLQQALNADRDNWIEYAVRTADALLLELSKSK